MKKIIVFCVAFLATMSLWASDTSVKNAYGVEIWYDFDNESNTASVTYRGFSSFEYYDRYTGEVVIPSKVTYEGKEYSVTSIGSCAFCRCSSLTSITIPDGVTEIESSAFLDCSSLTSITLPSSLTTIGNSAFDGCSSLTSITLPESLTKIGDGAFDGCSSLTSITLPESVTEIGNYVFSGCTLTSITLPESVTEIGEHAFYGCSSLTSIDVAPNNENYASIDGVLFSKDKTILIEYPEGKDATSYTIPEGVTEIGKNAFWDCSSLTSITIPEGVTKIGNSAFWDCSSLTSITLPDGVTSIGDRAFHDCDSLTSITLSESVTSIGEDAFYGCRSLTSIDVALNNENYASIDGVLFSKDKTILIQYPEGKDATSYMIPESVKSIEEHAFYRSSLTSITIPESVTWIGDYAFYDCDFTSITCKNTTPPESSYLTFYDVDKSIPLYVPTESVEVYKNTKYWEDFTNIQAIPFSSVANAKAETQDSVRKEYRDGQVLIIKGDKTYTMFGTEY